MRRWAFGLAIVALGKTASAEEAGPAAPLTEAVAADQVRRAADAFDEGTRAFRAGQFELAASLFEAADAAVPSAQALRMAIRARDNAGHRDRAATLAAQALARHESDAETRALAEGTVARHRAALERLTVTCATPCELAVGARIVPGRPAERWVLFLEPGEVAISATFVDGGARTQSSVQVSAGGESELALAAESRPAPPPPPPPPAPPPAVSPPPPVEKKTSAVEPSWIESPAVFFTALGATAVLGGVTIWSAVDTVNNPGEEAVRQACAGKGEDCPEYQDGLGRQTRTNVLIGVTGGMALVTSLVGLLVTDWSGGEVEADVAWGEPASLTLRGRW